MTQRSPSISAIWVEKFRSEETRIVRGLIDSKTDRIFSILKANHAWMDCRRFIGSKMDESALCFGETWGRRLNKPHLLLGRAFGELGLHKVWLIVRSDNEKGRKSGHR